MKLHSLKELVLIACLLFSSYSAIAQDSGLQMHAVSFGVGFATSSSSSAEIGPGLTLDISTIRNKHIFSFNFNLGTELNSKGPEEEFFEVNLTYGQKWNFSQNLFLEGHLGFGYFGYRIHTSSNIIIFDLPDSTIGFPLRAKVIYNIGKNFGIGLNTNVNFNSIANAYAANFIIQYNFN